MLADRTVIAERSVQGLDRNDLVAAMQRDHARTGQSRTGAATGGPCAGAEAGGRTCSGTIEAEAFADGHVELGKFAVKPGQIVGLGGLEGQGQKHLLRTLFAAGGRSHPALSVRGRVSFVSGDRISDGILPPWSVERNLSISALGPLTRFGLVSRKLKRRLAENWRVALGIKGTVENTITRLSGGTQQKALVGRALAHVLDVLLLDDTNGGLC